MWEYEYSVETRAGAERLWQLWADVAGWPEWNDGIEKIELDGPFAAGTTFRMTPPGEDPIALRIVEVVPGERFTDRMDADGFAVVTVHRLEPLAAGGTRVVYRTEITGPAAGEVGPAITADFPDVLAKLVALAER